MTVTLQLGQWVTSKEKGGRCRAWGCRRGRGGEGSLLHVPSRPSPRLTPSVQAPGGTPLYQVFGVKNEANIIASPVRPPPQMPWNFSCPPLPAAPVLFRPARPFLPEVSVVSLLSQWGPKSRGSRSQHLSSGVGSATPAPVRGRVGSAWLSQPLSPLVELLWVLSRAVRAGGHVSRS